MSKKKTFYCARVVSGHFGIELSVTILSQFLCNTLLSGTFFYMTTDHHFFAFKIYSKY